MGDDLTKYPGLGDKPKSDWPSVRVDPDKKAVEFLKPGSERHDRVKDYIVRRLESSERHMNKFYDRWQINEKKLQAYISLPDWEQTLKQLNDQGEVPKITRLTVPYTFATVMTITTFLMHAFAGHKPIFNVSSYKDEMVQASEMMQLKLQYDADHTKLIRHFWRFFQDTQVYGLGIMRCLWQHEVARRTVRKKQVFLTLEGENITRMEPVREFRTVYEGNILESQDPYMFFPDPRVPMTDVAAKGEFAFWRLFEGRHILKRLEDQGDLMWVDHAQRTLPANSNVQLSSRSLIAGGDSQPGLNTDYIGGLKYSTQVDQGTVEIIPRELGVGDCERVQKWIFTILNKDQIVQCEPFDADHDLHPVAIAEPYGMGYGFGEPGMVDFLGPIQDAISWFFNSHIDNVRKALNDMLIVDPSAIEMQDLKNPEPGKLIRLKRSFFGSDVRSAVNQLAITDVTKQHVDDAQTMFRMGQYLSSVTDNLMGMQQQGGRKTATEVRVSGEGASSRLQAQTRVISSQAGMDMTKMMCLNNQQYLSEEFYIQVVGREGIERPLRITPDQLVGDFYYPVNDGTLPQDKVALMDVWKEILLAVLQDPGLRAGYDVGKIFEYVAELGGAKNIESFKTQVMPDDQLDQQVQAGNMVPASQGNGQPGGTNTVNATPGNPADRLRGALT